ncbi:MAG: DNA repair protein [Clostridia bacterium]|nr:DNA repair protein [Clostridia bacterium]
MEDKTYLCIDLKSFYASVEAVERGLDPMTTNLVVADPSRGRGAICLAITPAMKELGIRNRCRLYEIPEGVEYITALPRMKWYMEYSARIYGIYLKYISKEDIHVYSIDECFFDVTPYLHLYHKTPREMAQMLIDAVYAATGISATAGIGTNLFLAKVALDITAKHVADRIGYLDEETYKRTIWHHRPITDIWNVGPGIAKRLEKYRIYDMEGVARANEQLLYREFGVNAEYLIDHAHGIEPCTIAEIHAYTPSENSIGNSQILPEDYAYEDAILILKEMVELLVLELVDMGMVTNSISLAVGYSGRGTKSTGGSRRLTDFTNSERKLRAAFEELFFQTTRKNIPIRRIGISFNHITGQDYVNLDLFSETVKDEKEQKKNQAILAIKKKYGKNAILKGMNFRDKATTRERNKLIGGHNSGE